MRRTSRQRVTRLLLVCGVVVGPLFVAAFLVEGATRSDYNWVRHPVSGLALGPHGWTQTANFLVAGVLTVAFAVGLRRHLAYGAGSRLLPALIAVWGLGLIGAGLFTTDPVSGYPPETPPLPVQPTWHGIAHDLVSIPSFLALALACFVFAYRLTRTNGVGWAVGSASAGAAFVCLFLLASAGFSQGDAFVGFAGLLQRAAVVIGQAWLCALAIRRLRTPTRDPWGPGNPPIR